MTARATVVGAFALALACAAWPARGQGTAAAAYVLQRDGTTIAAQVKMRNALKEMIRNKVVGSISDERVDAVVETMMAGAEAKNPAADFPWSSLDPTGIADIVIAYNYPVCADVK